MLVFFDDILVYSTELDSHKKHLNMVFNVLSDNQLFANQKKCVFGQSRVHYLGHWVSAEGMQTNGSKVQVMVEWPTPRNVTQLRGFLGLTGYYRRFVKDYGIIVSPLTQLLQKNAFVWSEKGTVAFDQLKRAMVTLPVLALPDFTKTFTIETDASGFGLRAGLMQEGRPIAFFSQKLTERGRAKSTYEQELMAVVLSVQRWRHYLLG